MTGCVFKCLRVLRRLRRGSMGDVGNDGTVGICMITCCSLGRPRVGGLSIRDGQRKAGDALTRFMLFS